MATNSEGELKPQDVVLGLEVAGGDGKDARERGVCKEGVCGAELGEAGGREGGFGGDVYCGAVETVRGWKLDGEEEEEKELGFAGAAVGVSCGLNS